MNSIDHLIAEIELYTTELIVYSINRIYTPWMNFIYDSIVLNEQYIILKGIKREGRGPVFQYSEFGKTFDQGPKFNRLSV